MKKTGLGIQELLYYERSQSGSLGMAGCVGGLILVWFKIEVGGDLSGNKRNPTRLTAGVVKIINFTGIVRIAAYLNKPFKK